jgi:Zn-finger nucleic acid-binding protein
MATKSKKKPAPPKKKPAAKKPAAKEKKPATVAAAPPPADDKTIQVLEAARADLVRLEGELQSAQAEGERLRGDVHVATDRFRTQSTELEQLRAETLKSAAELAAAARRADEAGRRADEREHERLRVMGDLDAMRRELDAARAELAGYTLRCPKCGQNFVEEVYEGITIDRCSGCDAIYFDAGEVDQLIAKVQEKMTAPSADPQQTSGWFRNLFKRKPKGEPSGSEPPPVA